MKQILSKIVLFCGGANVRFLHEHCPNERHKFYPIGLGVIITASLGFISMMFATHSIFGADNFGTEIVLILFSLFWGFAIFTIDWGLIKTMRKRKGGEELSAWEKIKSAIPVIFRLAVAIIISYSISRPLEVKIYEKRLKAQIEKDRQAFVTRENEKKKAEIEEYNQRLYGAQSRDSSLVIQKNSGNQSAYYKTLITEQKSKYTEIQDKKKVISARSADAAAIKNSGNSYYRDPITDELKWRSGPRQRYTNLVNTIIPQLRNDQIVLQRSFDSLSTKIKYEDSVYFADLKTRVDQAQDEVTNIISERDSIDIKNQESQEEIIRRSYISFDSTHPGLITQLESLHNFEQTPEGKSASGVRIILLLLIICIDTAPIVIKLLTKRGVYEDMQEADDERMKFLTKQEGYSNNHLIQQLALAQKEILSEAVKKWKDKERNREGMEDDYVNSNAQQNGNERT